uniref:C2H2-type domain-containing protein n=1 Tax=Clastoptera arizonana TaxID=38151 RepID=A0A1B6CLS2_9HEMI
MDIENLKLVGVGRRQPNDDLFVSGDQICRMFKREGIVDIDEEQLCHKIISIFQCELANCPREFTSILEYEDHYNSCHRFTCIVCKKSLPSSHLLDIHISETHDSFFLAQADRKPMYKCYVEDCDVKSLNAAERKSHCIVEHKLPPNFRFDCAPKKNIKKRNDNQMDVTEDKPKAPTKGPFTFGYNSQQKFCQRKPWHKRGNRSTLKPDKEQPLEMSQLMDTLPLEQ